MTYSNSINLVALALIIIMASCGPSTKRVEEEDISIENKELPTDVRAEKALYDEVMEVHDKAMPKMDNIMKLRGQLQEKMDLMADSDNPDETTIETLMDAIQDLENADEAMMQWMRNFETKEGDSLEHEVVMDYYENEKTEISRVHNQMEQAIKKAKELTKQ